MLPEKIWTAVIWAARIGIAALFFYAGFVKAGASEQFAVAISQFSLLPDWAVGGFAAVLPFAEIGGAILLLVPRTALAGAVVISLLLAAFIAALAWAFSQGIVVDCGCFGPGVASETQMALALARNVALLATTWILAARPLPARSK